MKIADGDTITVLDADQGQHKIRLEGIDAPEKRQAFGTKSRESLGEKVTEKEVRIVWEKKDRYGRILGDVYVDGRHINREMVADGLAWQYPQYNTSKELSNAEIAARKAKRGLWKDSQTLRRGSFGSAFERYWKSLLASSDLDGVQSAWRLRLFPSINSRRQSC